jgi:hypothetical protein
MTASLECLEPLDSRIVEVIDVLPDEIRFLTREELRARTFELAGTYPDRVRIQAIGASACGQDIELVEVQAGKEQPREKSRYAFLLGTPHPQELTGTLSIDHLTRQFAEHPDLLKEFGDYDGLVAITVSDPDGMRLNEGWFDDFSPLNYLSNMYRQPMPKQIEWSFPIGYKRLHFTDTPPETKAIMRVIRDYEPQLLCSLHNSALGGGYFYADPDSGPVFGQLQALTAHLKMPVRSGGTEVPYVTESLPGSGIYSPVPSVRCFYDYLQREGFDPLSHIRYGGGSKDFLDEVVPAAAHSISEIPYFTVPAFDDQSPSGMTFRDAVLEGFERREETVSYLMRQLVHIEHAPKSPLLDSAQWYLRFYGNNILMRRAILNTDAGNRADEEITVAESFIKRHVDGAFYVLAYGGALARVADSLGDDERAAELRHFIRSQLDVIQDENNTLYVRPLRDNVAAQVGSILVSMSSGNRRAAA